jgi:DNA invertase Pin-like site-specific DNA recombinase
MTPQYREDSTMPVTKRLIAYLRVSTKRQGQSGLGIEAQRRAVEEYARQTGGTIEAEYVEIETGKRKDRPELAMAVAHAKRTRATLLVAKLDRLARNAAFLLTLRDTGVPLAFCDMPGANELTVGIMAVVAEEEAKMISRRTKEALRSAKERGAKLGSARPGHWDGLEHRRLAGAHAAGKAAAESHRKAADESYADLLPMIRKLHSRGKSLQLISDELNGAGHSTRRGKPWNRMQVSRVLSRFADA